MAKPGQKQVSGTASKAASNSVKSRPEKSQKVRYADQKNRTAEEVLVNPQTCCSNCQTVFEVSLELLSTSDTRVRCGECLSVFDALSNLRDLTEYGDSDLSEAEEVGSQSDVIASDKGSEIDQRSNKKSSNPSKTDAGPFAGLANATASLDVTHSDFDLFSSDAGLPDIEFSDSTLDIRDFHFDDVSDIDDETFSDTLFAQDVTVDAGSLAGKPTSSQDSTINSLGSDTGFLTDDSDEEALIFNHLEAELPTQTQAQNSPQTPEAEPLVDSYAGELSAGESVDVITVNNDQGSLQVPESASDSWFMRAGLFVIVLIIAGSLYAYRQQDALLNDNTVRPLLSKACALLSCQLPDQVDLDSLRAVDRSVVRHPTIADALVIKFGIVNHAEFSQPYPVVEIRLEDRAGRLVVKNRFPPGLYSKGWQQGDKLDKGKRLDVGLAVEDPGNSAMSFELDFYEVK